jgi:hypothetical protein
MLLTNQSFLLDNRYSTGRRAAYSCLDKNGGWEYVTLHRCHTKWATRRPRRHRMWRRLPFPYNGYLWDAPKSPEYLAINPSWKIPTLVDADGLGSKPLLGRNRIEARFRSPCGLRGLATPMSSDSSSIAASKSRHGSALRDTSHSPPADFADRGDNLRIDPSAAAARSLDNIAWILTIYRGGLDRCERQTRVRTG